MSRLHLPWSPVYLLMLRFFTLRPTLSNLNNFIWTYCTNVCHFKYVFNVKMTTLVTSGHISLYIKYWKDNDNERFAQQLPSAFLSKHLEIAAWIKLHHMTSCQKLLLILFPLPVVFKTSMYSHSKKKKLFIFMSNVFVISHHNNQDVLPWKYAVLNTKTWILPFESYIVPETKGKWPSTKSKNNTPII